ncbi:MAG: YhcG family protein [Pirellulales bacterium]
MNGETSSHPRTCFIGSKIAWPSSKPPFIRSHEAPVHAAGGGGSTGHSDVHCGAPAPDSTFGHPPHPRKIPDEEIVATLSRQLSWSHFVEIIPLEEPFKRDFYAEMCRIERWSVRTLRRKIDHLLFERTAVAKKPEKLIEQDLSGLRKEDQLTPDLVFRDPYFLDFLGLSGQYAEKDLEQAILRELEAFILELGTDFAFVTRQKRITVDNEDYYLDLLFYHRRLRRLVAIDLKLGKFQAADKGQMELYLRWLEKYEVQPEEEPPIGLLLCADKSEEHVELLELEKSGIRVAAYLTELPPRELLEKKLHEAIRWRGSGWQPPGERAKPGRPRCPLRTNPPAVHVPSLESEGSDAMTGRCSQRTRGCTSP